MQINELPQEILESEFPELVSKNVKRDILLIDNGQKVIISSPDAKGQYHGKVYEFNQPKENIVYPNTPIFSETLSRVDCDRWDGRLDDTFRSDYNNNLKEIQHSVNELISDNLLIRKYIEDVQNVFNHRQENLIRLISLVVADYIDKNYYQKSEVDSKISLLNKRLDNLQARVNAAPAIGPYANPSRTDQYPSNLDVNDQVTPEAEQIIEDFNK
ncbi:MAG: hypothetical protein J6573_07525 [Lactobacillus sp.]|nr:hypothetical protein [Lactobacillus sp.]